MLVPGAPDIMIASPKGVGFLELKKPAERTLLYKSPQGRLSIVQREFKDRCDRIGVPYAVCTSWDECRAALSSWGMI